MACKKIFFIFLIIFLTNYVYSSCTQNQININTASLADLDKLYGIGPVKAQAIIDSRPFKTIDDLINVKGIGEVTLEKIKSQNLACVSNKEINTSQENLTIKLEENNKKEQENKNKENSSLKISKTKENLTLDDIILNPKDIKNINHNNFSINKIVNIKYGLIYFCILLGILFAIQILNKNKNGLV